MPRTGRPPEREYPRAGDRVRLVTYVWPEHFAVVEDLRRLLDLSRSEVVRRAVEEYAERLLREEGGP